jgi:hypothetical protein
MADIIYRLRHPSGDFTGYFVVDFYHGIGSTNDKADADRLVSKHGCELIVESETKDGAGAEQSAPVPVISEPEIIPGGDPFVRAVDWIEEEPDLKVKPNRKPIPTKKRATKKKG